MLTCFARVAILGFALAAGTGAATAGDLADFNAAAEAAEAHNRVAIGYLRTGNTDLASIEIDGLRAAWKKLTERFAEKRPDPFDGDAYYGIAMTDIGVRLVTADMMLNSGRTDSARQALQAIRDDLYKLRQSAGVVVLADYVRDANTAMGALLTYNNPSLDWSKSATRLGIASHAAIYEYVLNRCDRFAGESIRKDPKFRRLVDGAKAGLALIPKAIATRDTDLLHRILIELRSFDNLLEFRFG